MIVLRTQDQQTTVTPNGNTVTPLATPSRGAHEVSMVRQSQTPGGFNPPHSQNREEIMVQLAGQVTVTSGNRSAILSPGDTLTMPADTVHQVQNTGDTDAEWLIISAAGMHFVGENGVTFSPDWIK
ncbi:cupin domain-containing protein [Deinococcus sp.]|uniref:cupin domain-containing protein n=1 Tax=Deinococcus sp. TaxID=47478 RepID=UPI003B5C89A5